jgi:peptidyl-tRNA hydrolase, PTH1 family
VPALIVGLGNPGKEYADTRHNVGFRTVEELARRARLTWEKPRLKAEQARGTIAGREVVLAKPQTYMNLSGVSVVQLVRWYKVPLDQLLIVHDDLDLPFGQLRLRAEGSAGGQNGMGSIIEQLRTKAIHRLKIGIGRPTWGDPKDYVLTRFTKDQAADLPIIIARAADAAELWLAEGIIPAMNRFNGLALPDRARP